MSGPVIVGVLLKDVYNFLMDFSSLEKFLNLYTIYESNNFLMEMVSIIRLNITVGIQLSDTSGN